MIFYNPDGDDAKRYLFRKWTRLRYEHNTKGQKAYEYAIYNGADHIKAAKVRFVLEILQHIALLAVLPAAYFELGAIAVACIVIFLLGMFPIRYIVGRTLVQNTTKSAKKEYGKLLIAARSEIALLYVFVIMLFGIIISLGQYYIN